MKTSHSTELKDKYNGTPTKKRLKIMAKNSHGHFFRNRTRIIKYGASGFFRHIWLSLVATIVTTFTLIILFVTVIASVVLSSTADYMRQKIDITVYFLPDTTDEELASMTSTMKKDPNVTNVETYNSEQEYNRSLSENTSDEEILNILKEEEMREAIISTMYATMRIKVADSSNLDSVKNIVDNDRLFVENTDPSKMPSYDANSTQIATITSWADIAKNGGLILSAIFLVISVLVIFNTIRMAIFSRREEIYMEKLIGASNSFIRGPFLVEAEICGILAGVISSIACLLAFNILAPRLAGYGIHIDNIKNITNSQWIIVVFATSIILGWLINMISARLAVQKYLR